jgi:hypothetical protein
MKKKKLYPILAALVLVIFFYMTLTSCKELLGLRDEYPDEVEVASDGDRAFQEAISQKAEEDYKRAEAAGEITEKAAEEVTEETSDMEASAKAADDIAEEATEETSDAEAAEAADDVALVDDVVLLNETITYSITKDGFTVTIIVDFKTTDITGSLSLSGENYIDATITDGKINKNTLDITANYSGTMGSSGTDYPFNGTITGTISDDLSTLNGTIRDDGGESTKLIAKRETAQ